MPPEFVGRTNELHVLLSALESAKSGRPSCVLVEGEGGSGKTALLHAFQEFSTATVTLASSDEAESAMPYEVLDALARQLDLSGTRVGPATDGPGHIFTDWGGDPFAAGAALLQHLDRASGLGPLLVIVDDVNLADDPSVAALTFAARRLQADPVMILLAARSDAVPQLPPGLRRLVDDRGARVTLRGLSTEEVRRLAEATGFGQLSARAAARLRDHTSGNPLLVRAVLAELTLEQAEAQAEPLPVPRSFALLVLAAVGATSPSAQALAAAAAVLGHRSMLKHAAAVAQIEDAREAVDELSRALVLESGEGPGGTVVRFLHPLIRLAVYDDIGLVAQAALHSRAAAVVSNEEALRHRVAAAPGPDPLLAAALRGQAARDAQSGRAGAAAAGMLAASKLCAPGPEQDEALLAAIDLLLLAGDVGAAERFAHLLAEMAPSGHRLQVQARLAWLSGRDHEAEMLGKRAWERATDMEPAERDHLAAMLAQIAILRNEGAAAAKWADRALASGLLPPTVASATLAAAVMGLGVSGGAAEGLARLAFLPADPAEVAVGQGPLLTARGVMRMITDDLEGARGDLAAMVPSAARGMGQHQLSALGMLVDVEYRDGNWDASTAFAEQLLGLIDDTGAGMVPGFRPGHGHPGASCPWGMGSRGVVTRCGARVGRQAEEPGESRLHGHGRGSSGLLPRRSAGGRAGRAGSAGRLSRWPAGARGGGVGPAVRERPRGPRQAAGGRRPAAKLDAGCPSSGTPLASGRTGTCPR